MKQILVIILVIDVGVLACAPAKQTKANESRLECYLNQYLESVKHLDEEAILLIDAFPSWSDTTFLFSIKNMEKRQLMTGSYKFTKYGSKLIYCPMKSFDFLKDAFIKKDMTWHIEEVESLNELVPPEEYDEVQSVINKSNYCVQKSDLLGNNSFRKLVEMRCNKCRS